ncbi:MAG: GNAT family N-acetyltransferase [Thomasclavelia ramosa]
MATGRMYFEDGKTMILGRIAVIKEYRGTGLGSKVVKSLENKKRN